MDHGTAWLTTSLIYLAAAVIAAACGGNASPSPTPEPTALPSQTTDASPGAVSSGDSGTTSASSFAHAQ